MRALARLGAHLLAPALLLVSCGDGAPDGLRSVSTAAEGWTLTAVGAGVKPSLALDEDGRPAVTFVREGNGGSVSFAAAADGWDAVVVSEGNYAGPADLAFDAEGRPHAAWHDHELAEVSPRFGNVVHAVREGGGWQVETVRDGGHDGFQTSLAVSANGVVHAAGIEPVQYRTDQGVEHFEQTADGWRARTIGTGALEYSYDVSLALGPEGLPALTYHDDRADALVFASTDGTRWTLERVASRGEAGRRSSLAFDRAGRAHVAFVQEGSVRYAVREAEGWRTEDVGPGDGGVALALDPGGRPQVAFVAGRAVRLGRRGGSGWEVLHVGEAGGRPLGTRLSLAVDGAGSPHLAFAELLDSKRGIVVYATREGDAEAGA